MADWQRLTYSSSVRTLDAVYITYQEWYLMETNDEWVPRELDDGEILSIVTNFTIMWHDRGHSFLWVWVSASQSVPLSVLARNPHKGLTREISYETGRRRMKARSQGREQKKGVERRQSIGESRRVTAGRGAGPWGSRGLVGRHERMNQRSRWLWGNFARIHARDSPLMHRKLH